MYSIFAKDQLQPHQAATGAYLHFAQPQVLMVCVSERFYCVLQKSFLRSKSRLLYGPCFSYSIRMCQFCFLLWDHLFVLLHRGSVQLSGLWGFFLIFFMLLALPSTHSFFNNWLKHFAALTSIFSVALNLTYKRLLQSFMHFSYPRRKITSI